MASSLGTAILELTATNAALVAKLDESKALTESSMAETGGIVSHHAQLIGAAIAGAFAVEKIVEFGKSSVEAAMAFEKSMTLIHTNARVSTAAVDDMSQGILRMAASVGTTPEVLSEGMYHLASSGLRGAQAMEALRVAAEGAKVGNADLESVTNALGVAIASGIKGVTDINGAMGMMLATVGAGDMKMQDLADAFGTGLPTKAAIFGVSLQDVGAALAVFGDNLIRGAAAGTLLNSTIRLMGAESPTAAKALATVGLSSTQLADDMRGSGGLVSAIEDLKTHMEAAGLSATQQAQLLTEAFGGKQAGGVMILVDQLDRLKTKEEEVALGSKSFGDAWQATTETAQFNMDKFHAAMDVLKITLGAELLPAVSAVAAGLAELIGWLTNGESATQHFRDAMEALGVSASTQAQIIRDMGVAWRELQAVVAAVVDALQAAWPTIEAGARAAVAAIGTAISEVRSHWGEITADVERAMNDVRGAVQAGVTAITFIWDNFHNQITAVVNAAWNTIKGVVRGSLTEIQGIFNVITGLIHGNWSQVWQGLGQIVSGALTVVKSILTGSVSATVAAAEAVGKAAVMGISAGLSALGSALEGAGRALAGAITTIAGEAVGWAHKIGTEIIAGIVEGLASLAAKVGAALKSVETAISAAAADALGWAVNIGQSIVAGVVAGLGGLGAAIKSKAEGLIHSALSSLNPFSPVEHGGEIYIGQPIVDGAVKGLSGLGPRLGDAINGALGSVVKSAQAAVDPLSGAFSQSVTMAMVKAAYAPEIAAAAAKIGPAAEDAILKGLLPASQTFADQLKAANQQAVEQANQATIQKIQEAQGQFNSAFSNLASGSISAFNTAMSGWKSPARIALEKMQQSDDEERYHQAVVSAAQKVADDEAAITKAAADGDVAAQASAHAQLLTDQQAYGAAKHAEEEYYIGISAAADEAAHAQQQQSTAAHLSALLAQLQGALPAHVAEWVKTHAAILDAGGTFNANSFAQHDALLSGLLEKLKASLAEHPGIWDATHAQIIALINGYESKYQDAGGGLGRAHADGIRGTTENSRSAMEGVVGAAFNEVASAAGSFFNAGVSIGNSLADGLRSTAQVAASAAGGVASDIFDFFKMKSPAKIGPLSEMPNWGNWFLPGLKAVRYDVGQHAHAIAQAAVTGFGDGGAGFGVAGGAGSSGDIVLEVDGQAFARISRKQLDLAGRRNGVALVGAQ